MAKMYKLDEDILENIDTDPKAYLLGWIARNITATENRIDITIDSQYIKYIRLLRDIVCKDIPIISENTTNLMTFTINSKKIYEDVCFHLKIDKMINFPKLESVELTWSFLRGYYDSDDNFCKQLSLHPICSIFSDSKIMLKAIGEFSKIPYNLKNNTIIFSNTNCIDFLGKLYSTPTNYKLLYKYNMYVNWITPKSGSSLPEAYVLKTDKDAILPSKSKTSDVGYDLSIIKESKKLLNNVILYDTGIQICVQHGLYAEVVPRSSLSKSGYMLANSIGIIDPSYTGNIFIALIKICPDAEEIQFPFRCCQIIFRQQYHVNINNSLKSFEETARGDGGFGSTGI